MKDKLKGVAIAIAAVAVLAVGAAAIAGATGGGDDAADQAISGQALDRAKAAALDHTGGGTVTETEAGDGEGAYEVEVTRANGSQVEVQLDKGFNVISQAGDDDTGGENESEGEED
jgi:uncharacterized membrane protein YkoI